MAYTIGTKEKPMSLVGTIQAWGRSPKNPVGGWYGLKKGLRGRFGMYIPPLMEALGLAEVTHDPKNNKMKAKQFHFDVTGNLEFIIRSSD